MFYSYSRIRIFFCIFWKILLEARKILTSFWLDNFGLGHPSIYVREFCIVQCLFSFPITCERKLKLLLYTHCHISVFSQHGFSGIEWDMIMLKIIKMWRGGGQEKNGRGWFLWFLISNLHYQVCYLSTSD